MQKRAGISVFAVVLAGLIGVPVGAQEPSARCGPTGEIIVEVGQPLPLPNSFSNPTPYTVTYHTIDNSTNLFNLPSPLVDPRHGTIVLAPNTSRDYPDLGFPLPATTPTGTDTVVLDVFANACISPVGTRIWGPFKCTYTLTVIPPIKDLIRVPVRWCAVEGSPQAAGVKGPAANGGRFETTRGFELMRLLQRLNDQIFIPQADTHIYLQHAAAPQGIPVIDDPDGPTGRCTICDIPGVFDTDPPSLARPLERAVSQCRQAWDALYPGRTGITLINPTALAFDEAGAAIGFTDSEWEKYRGQVCNHPAVLPVEVLQALQGLAAFDPAYDGQRSGEISIDSALLPTLAHELAHTLTLGHGDGLDNNMDGTLPPTRGRRLYDKCDPLGVEGQNEFPIEDRGSTALSIMSYVDSNVITPLQKDTLRAMAKLTPGASYTGVNDPAGSLVAPQKACEPRCTLAPDVFLTEAGFAITPNLASTSVWHTVRAEAPATTTNHYLAFVDLDNSATTGCDPSSVFPEHPGFAGAELVSRVVVTTTGSDTRATPAVWRCEGGRLVPISDPAIEARILKPRVLDVRRPRTAPPPPLAMIVSVSMPDSLRGPAGNQIRLQAVAARAGGDVDRLPSGGKGGVISLIPAALPECTVFRPLHAPGERATVRAAKLTPNKPADVLLGDRIVATGTTSATGDVAIDFIVPATARSGLRPVAVILQGGAESATCSIFVQGKPVTPGTMAEVSPPPAGTGWNNTDVSVKLTATDVPGGTGIRDITYSAAGAQSIPPTRVASNPATVALSAEGSISLSYFATNNAGVAEAPQTVAVRIDKTPPVVTYTGNAGAYRIAAIVDIRCTATDAVSGVLHTTCRDIKGPAYTFPPGKNTFNVNAVDLAFNATPATTSFTVNVTYTDLCELTKQLRSGTALGNSLCAILGQAEREQAAGNAARKAERTQAYIDRVRENVPRVFSEADAEILIRLATVCVNGAC